MLDFYLLGLTLKGVLVHQLIETDDVWGTLYQFVIIKPCPIQEDTFAIKFLSVQGLNRGR
jgi:hypothetical protein